MRERLSFRFEMAGPDVMMQLDCECLHLPISAFNVSVVAALPAVARQLLLAVAVRAVAAYLQH